MCHPVEIQMRFRGASTPHDDTRDQFPIQEGILENKHLEHKLLMQGTALAIAEAINTTTGWRANSIIKMVELFSHIFPFSFRFVFEISNLKHHTVRSHPLYWRSVTPLSWILCVVYNKVPMKNMGLPFLSRTSRE